MKSKKIKYLVRLKKKKKLQPKPKKTKNKKVIKQGYLNTRVLLQLDNCQRLGITNHPNLAMVYPTRRTKLCRTHCPTHKKTSKSKAFCTSKQQNNQTWIN